ncbi:MAG: hypothetical protein HFJ40_03820 [Clostridia bacterium]|nr:hypothetical protein [Clostridia bacterium]
MYIFSTSIESGFCDFTTISIGLFILEKSQIASSIALVVASISTTFPILPEVIIKLLSSI